MVKVNITTLVLPADHVEAISKVLRRMLAWSIEEEYPQLIAQFTVISKSFDNAVKEQSCEREWKREERDH